MAEHKAQPDRTTPPSPGVSRWPPREPAASWPTRGVHPVPGVLTPRPQRQAEVGDDGAGDHPGPVHRCGHHSRLGSTPPPDGRHHPGRHPYRDRFPTCPPPLACRPHRGLGSTRISARVRTRQAARRRAVPCRRPRRGRSKSEGVARLTPSQRHSTARAGGQVVRGQRRARGRAGRRANSGATAATSRRRRATSAGVTADCRAPQPYRRAHAPWSGPSTARTATPGVPDRPDRLRTAAASPATERLA
jgi:hypothetical protein